MTVKLNDFTGKRKEKKEREKSKKTLMLTVEITKFVVYTVNGLKVKEERSSTSVDSRLFVGIVFNL